LRFERTGSVVDEQRFGRRKTATNDDIALKVLQSVIENHHKHPSKTIQECNISRRSVVKILKNMISTRIK